MSAAGALTAIWRSSRVPFLLLTPLCVLLAAATAAASGTPPDYGLLALAGVGALAAHASVNLLNEYQDFTTGIDGMTRRTPFSGGSGHLPAHPDAARSVHRAAWAGFALTAAIGLLFVVRQGGMLLVPGVVGLLLIVGYTRWLNRHPWLCLMAPGVGIGLCMVLGAHLALGAPPTPQAWLCAGLLFAAGNNLLLLNQIPDIDADRTGGRRHFAIVYGIRGGFAAYAFFLLLQIALWGWGLYSGILPTDAAWAGSAFVPALAAVSGFLRFGARVGGQPWVLASNVAACLLLPALLAFALRA